MDLVRILRAGADHRSYPVQRVDITAGGLSPRWPSGITRLDYKTDGGFYGFSVVASAPKTGKTRLAIRSSSLAAADGWRVIYWTGENTEYVFRESLQAIWGPMADWPFELMDWTALRFDPGITMRKLIEETCEQIDTRGQRLLIVLDSINRLAKYLARDGGNFFRSLESIVSFCQQITERSDGQIGMLALSELNQRGGAVGLDIEYAAGLVLQLRRAGKKPGFVSMKLESRESGGGSLGTFWRDAERCEFIHEETHREAVKERTLDLVKGGLFDA